MKSMLSNHNKQTYLGIGGGIIVLILIGLVVWFLTTRGSGLDQAAALYQQGKVVEASAEYKKVLDKFGGTAEAWNNYANTLRDQNKYQEASDAYRRAIAINPSYAAAYRNLSYLHLDWEEVGSGTGKIDEAITIIETGFNNTGKKILTLAEDLIMLYGKKGNEAKVAEYKAIREKLLAEE